MPKAYVVGFIFNLDLSKVVLIEKKRPEIQVGRLNGPGGKIELGESPIGAMVREAQEELGIRTENSDWLKFHQERFMESGNTVHFYTMQSDLMFASAETCTDELVVKHLIHRVPYYNPMYNLCYLIPMAISYITHPQHRYYEG